MINYRYRLRYWFIVILNKQYLFKCLMKCNFCLLQLNGSVIEYCNLMFYENATNFCTNHYMEKKKQVCVFWNTLVHLYLLKYLNFIKKSLGPLMTRSKKIEQKNLNKKKFCSKLKYTYVNSYFLSAENSWLILFKFLWKQD